MTERWRLFIALPLPEVVRVRVRAAQVAAREAGFAARWVAPDSAHLTLKFLGDTDPALVARLAARLREIAGSRNSFTLLTGQLGAFPSTKRPRVLWLGLGGELAPLDALHGAIDAGLIPVGFPREARPFRPHLTLGRLREHNPAPPAEALRAAQLALGATVGAFPVTEVSLIRSELGRAGPRYTTLDTLPLATAHATR